MPYKTRKVKGGYKVFRGRRALSKKPLSRKQARRQQEAVYLRTHGR